MLSPIPSPARDSGTSPRGKHRVTIAAPDATRPSPDDVLIPLLLEELNAGGIHRDDVTILMGLGMHRPSTLEERVQKFGGLLGEIRIEESAGANVADFVEVGEARPFDQHRYPILLNRRVVDAPGTGCGNRSESILTMWSWSGSPRPRTRTSIRRRGL